MRQTKQKRTKRRRTTMKRIKKNKVMYGGTQLIHTKLRLRDVETRVRFFNENFWFQLYKITDEEATEDNFDSLRIRAGYDGKYGFNIGETYSVRKKILDTGDIFVLNNYLKEQKAFEESGNLKHGFELVYYPQN
jgi:hypothetical protein